VDRSDAHLLGVANRRNWWLIEERSTATCR
jgi:hypothetical protein